MNFDEEGNESSVKIFRRPWWSLRNPLRTLGSAVLVAILLAVFGMVIYAVWKVNTLPSSIPAAVNEDVVPQNPGWWS